MFLLLLHYKKPLTEIDKLVEKHIAFLDKYYQSGHFICSGRRKPRTGGVILCKAMDLEEVKALIEEDPFYKEKAAEYEMIEFAPTKYAAQIASLCREQNG